MQTVGLQHLQEEVRKIFDEIGVNTAVFLDKDIDDENLDTGIVSKVAEAVRYVHLQASPARLYDAEIMTAAATIVDEPIKKAVIVLPANFLRIAKLKFSDWNYPIYLQEDEFSPEYHKQVDYYACGTYESPRAFLVKKTSDLQLECYSCKTKEATVESLLWIPEPEIKTPYSKAQIPICEKCEIAIVYRIAGLTLTNYNETDKAKTCFELCEFNLK